MLPGKKTKKTPKTEKWMTFAAALASFDSASGQSQKAMYGAAWRKLLAICSVVDPVGAGSRPFTTTTTTTLPLHSHVTDMDAYTLASP